MHTLKIDFKEYGNKFRILCPYCTTEQWAPLGAPYYIHNCDEAGKLWLMNGHMFVDVGAYMTEDKNSTLNH